MGGLAAFADVEWRQYLGLDGEHPTVPAKGAVRDVALLRCRRYLDGTLQGEGLAGSQRGDRLLALHLQALPCILCRERVIAKQRAADAFHAAGQPVQGLYPRFDPAEAAGFLPPDHNVPVLEVLEQVEEHLEGGHVLQAQIL
ncbi:MAG: hypothetical protein BWY25_01178 [Chloroflexi bacterium ADurb.Bin222]|nr:MAG: hypothetical protein BWY25_01178 [Chloroflexi bacterium ADurb.Bin222]